MNKRSFKNKFFVLGLVNLIASNYHNNAEKM